MANVTNSGKVGHLLRDVDEHRRELVEAESVVRSVRVFVKDVPVRVRRVSLLVRETINTGTHLIFSTCT